MKREVWADAKVEAMVNEGFVAVLVDVDDPQSVPVLERYNVGGTPWTIFTDPHDQVLDYRYGAMPKAEFMAMLTQNAANGSRRELGNTRYDSGTTERRVLANPSNNASRWKLGRTTRLTSRAG